MEWQCPQAFRSGMIATLVFGILFSQPITSVAQTSEDADVSALKADAEQHFRDYVAPFIKTYCLGCHSSKRPTEAGVNFSPALKSPGHAAFSRQWKKAAARVKAHDMPPDDATSSRPMRIGRCSSIGCRR